MAESMVLLMKIVLALMSYIYKRSAGRVRLVVLKSKNLLVH